jgi:hypothetical protein
MEAIIAATTESRIKLTVIVPAIVLPPFYFV